MKRIITTLLLLTLATPSCAGWNEAVAAYGRGDYAIALRELRPFAEQGYARAQFNLAIMYSKGQGVPKDYAKAAKWWRKAAEQGDAKAQFNLGYMYSKGQGVPQDYVQAHKWYDLSTTQGNNAAAKYRDIVAKRMTPADIFKSQQLANKWWTGHCQTKEHCQTKIVY